MIYGSNSVMISNNVTTTINKKPVIVRNTLLDGSAHIQIIGSPITEISFSTVVDLSGKEAFEAAFSTGDTIQINTDNAVYSGLITDLVHKSRMSNVYELSGTLVVEAVV